MNTQSTRRLPQLPAPSAQRFPREAWYIAAAGVEIGRKIVKRKINGEAMVLFRRTDGRVAALRDACPHKGFPLSRGVLIGDDLRCGYHGISFSGDGRCTRIPSQEGIPPAMRTRAYPVVERWLFIWVWIGDPEKADASRIPSFGPEGGNGFQEEFLLSVEVACNAQFLIDNVLDHTHFSYLHQGGFDNDPDFVEEGAEFARTPLHVERKGDMVRAWRDLPGIVPNEGVSTIYQVAEGKPIDQHIDTRFFPANGYVHSRIWFTDPRQPQKIVSEALGAGCMTPMDEGHCLHIVTWSSSYRQHEKLKDIITVITNQDIEVLPDIQRHYSQDDDVVEVSLLADHASMLSRRIVAEALRAEERGNTDGRRRSENCESPSTS